MMSSIVLVLPPLTLLLVLMTMASASSLVSTACFSSNLSSPSSSSLLHEHSNDVAVVGCGVLGTIVCSKLLTHPAYGSRNIIGITKGTLRHEEIRSAIHVQVEEDGEDTSLARRFQLLTLNDALSQGQRFRDVVFCAPPSGFDDYALAISMVATMLWSGLGEADDDADVDVDKKKKGEGRGSFVFTSSGVVYGDGSGSIVDESSPTVVSPNESEKSGSGQSSSSSVSKDGEKNPRALRMLHAEHAALSVGGCALRLAGLYSLDRGAHNYWLTKLGSSTVQGRGDGIVNLLHYEDAASAALAALQVGPGVNARRVFLISDGHPTTRRGICESALRHPRYSALGMPNFATVDDELEQRGGGKGKVYDGRKSNEALLWTPTYPSFDEFMTSSSFR